jgi:hypothetical protein
MIKADGQDLGLVFSTICLENVSAGRPEYLTSRPDPEQYFGLIRLAPPCRPQAVREIRPGHADLTRKTYLLGSATRSQMPRPGRSGPSLKMDSKRKRRSVRTLQILCIMV